MKLVSLLASVGLVGVCAGVMGCSSRSKMPVYDPSQVGTVMRTEKGEIVSVRDVLIKPQPPSGTSVGSVLGRGAATGGVGAAGAVGSVIGAAVGAKSDEKLGEELTILVEGGQTIVIVQERDPNDPPFAPGEKVTILTGTPSFPTRGSYPGGIWGGRGIPSGVAGGNTRVVRDHRFAAGGQE